MVVVTDLAGRRLIDEGREAEIYEWDDGFVLRLMRSPLAGESVDRSTLASEVARASGVHTPKVVEVTEVDGRPAQVMERVDGPDMFSHIAANPMRVVSMARRLGKAHAELHDVEAPDELESLHAYLGGRMESSALIPNEVKSQALDALDGLPLGSAICHGDFHPGNVLLTESGPVLLDWSNAARGDATADFARTRLMLRVGELPPGAPVVIRVLAGIGRGALRHLYERSYRKLRPVDLALARRWDPVLAADRLADDIPAEREALLAIARSGFQ